MSLHEPFFYQTLRRLSNGRLRTASRWRHLLAAFVFVLAEAGFGTSCAYRLGSGNRQLPGGYRSVAVPVFRNATTETGVEVYFTNSIVRELERSKVVEVVGKSQSQVVLEGEVTSIIYSVANPVSGDGQSLPTNTILNAEYRILLAAKVQLKRSSDLTVIWQGTFNGERSYLAPHIGLKGLNSASALYNQSARSQNIEILAADLMAEAADRITENF